MASMKSVLLIACSVMVASAASATGVMSASMLPDAMATLGLLRGATGAAKADALLGDNLVGSAAEVLRGVSSAIPTELQNLLIPASLLQQATGFGTGGESQAAASGNEPSAEGGLQKILSGQSFIGGGNGGAQQALGLGGAQGLMSLMPANFIPVDPSARIMPMFSRFPAFWRPLIEVGTIAPVEPVPVHQ